jgi:hypothetical protein
MTDEKKTGVSFECTQKQRDNYIKAAGGKKLAVWITSVLDAAVKQKAGGKVKPVIDDDDGDSFGNR